MATSTNLGGFKALKNVDRISLSFPYETGHSPAELFQVITEEKINLLFITCIHDIFSWSFNIVVDSINAKRISEIIEKNFGKIYAHDKKRAILSVFPHKKKPEITGLFFEVFAQEKVASDALANSSSAISVVLKEKFLNKASNALFGPFSFSAYRTPPDWKLAQTGKEQLYKEVIASYQEQSPKVYSLDYYDGQEFLHIKLKRRDVGRLGVAFKEFARLGLENLTFLATGPCSEKNKEVLALSLPNSDGISCEDIIKDIAPETEVRSISPTITFSMTGPHFGDRYGIACELLNAFEKKGVDLIALNCTIASITGVVPFSQLEWAIQAIKGHFEVPSIIKKES